MSTREDKFTAETVRAAAEAIKPRLKDIGWNLSVAAIMAVICVMEEFADEKGEGGC